MFCRHKWYEISREFYAGNRSIAWCETCGELKFTNYRQKERPVVVLRTPKIMKRKNSPASPAKQTKITTCPGCGSKQPLAIYGCECKECGLSGNVG